MAVIGPDLEVKGIRFMVESPPPQIDLYLEIMHKEISSIRFSCGMQFKMGRVSDVVCWSDLAFSLDVLVLLWLLHKKINVCQSSSSTLSVTHTQAAAHTHARARAHRGFNPQTVCI